MGILRLCFADEMATIFIRIFSAALNKSLGILPHFRLLSGLLFYLAVVDRKLLMRIFFPLCYISIYLHIKQFIS